jgi:hypothetical protein
MAQNSVRPRRAAYIQALKSGEYKQGYGTYYNALNDTYCAVGVAAQLLAGNVWEADRVDLDEHIFFGPAERWAIISLNDNAQLSFEEIANKLEKGEIRREW